MSGYVGVRSLAISIHALREEGDTGFGHLVLNLQISIHALREEGDQCGLFSSRSHSHFYPRPPRGGRRCRPPFRTGADYFYPRPPRGGRPVSSRLQTDTPLFLSTPSARRATNFQDGLAEVVIAFLSTPSARRATVCPPTLFLCRSDFYPRPPRGGRRPLPSSQPVPRHISIHALREEGDASAAMVTRCFQYFYPRPPRGGRPSPRYPRYHSRNISIHALREEGDSACLNSEHKANTFLSTPSARRATSLPFPTCAGKNYFYPRPPRGGRRRVLGVVGHLSLISIHALREEGDMRLTCVSLRLRDFYPRPPRGGRRTSAATGCRSTYFYPRPPRGGRLTGQS